MNSLKPGLKYVNEVLLVTVISTLVALKLRKSSCTSPLVVAETGLTTEKEDELMYVIWYVPSGAEPDVKFNDTESPLYSP
jgi:hypothetical protein